MRYSLEFQKQVIEKAQTLGIKPLAREYRLSRNTIKRWIHIYKTKGLQGLASLHQKALSASEIEAFIITLKEKNPNATLRDIKNELKIKKGEVLSINGVHRVLKKFGMTGTNYLPFRVATNREINGIIDYVRVLISKKQIKEAAEVLNSVPALSNFSVLKDVPDEFLTLRRRVERLEALWGSLPMDEMYKRARELRRYCEKEKLFFTGIFVTTLEMNALNFLGRPNKVAFLYNKYFKYVPGLPLPLKYTFLMESFIAFMRAPKKFPIGIFKNFLSRLERFCLHLPASEHRFHWYDAISACFQIIGEINKSQEWLERLLEEIDTESRKEYLPEYLSLLATTGAYTEVLENNEFFENMATPLVLRASLARGNALLGTGRPKEALELALNSFYKAKEEHLRPAMAGFTFFISCCYAAQKETKKARRYLRMSLYFSKNIERLRLLYSLFLKCAPNICPRTNDHRIRLIIYYLRACSSLRKKDYMKAYRFAVKKGLQGLLHHIILLNPEAVNNLLKKGKDTLLSKEFLRLPVFKGVIPVLKLLLLKEKEAIFYGEHKIKMSPRTKDFHLLVYLFLNRKKHLKRDDLTDIFYHKVQNPIKSLTKALSRIRRILNLPREVLSSTQQGVFFNIETKIDLEEFEERFRMGRIFEKVGEIKQALKEYQECFAIYKKSPFERMGYYYNFAEDRRTLARNMFEHLCYVLLEHAKQKKEEKVIIKIIQKLKKEGYSNDKSSQPWEF